MTLNPPAANSRHDSVAALFVANPDAWITRDDIYTALDWGRGTNLKTLHRLVRNGYVEYRDGGAHRAFHLLRTPPTTRRPGRVPAQRPAGEDRNAARQQARLEETQAIRRADHAAVIAALTEHPNVTQPELVRLSGLSVGRVNLTLREINEAGRLIRTNGEIPRYSLLRLSLPEVPSPVLTPQARRVLEHLRRLPADTELGMVAALRMTRGDVCLALAHLRGLGALSWSGIGHLVLYRATRVEDRRAA